MSDNYLEIFVEESQEHLNTIEPDFLTLEEAGENVDLDVINRIFRGIHSLKGSSGFFGLKNIEKLSHIMETLLTMVRDGSLKVSTELTDYLLAGMDSLKDMVGDVESSDKYDISSEMNDLKELLDKAKKAEKDDAKEEIQEEDNDKQEDESLDKETSEDDIQLPEKTSEEVQEEKITQPSKPIETKPIPKPPPPTPPKPQIQDAKAKSSSKSKVHTDEKIRVSVSFLNDLVNIAGELVLGRNQLMQISGNLVKDTPGLNTVLQHINRVTSEMQEKIMQMRMQPVSMLFGKFQRIVRDLSKSLKKEIRLETYGEEVELDKTIIESLSDPLTHLIRNSVDHGIESPDDREARGKNKQGKIVLQAYHEGGQVHLEIKDDGKGIDGNIVAQKALEKGIVTESELEGMGEKDMVKLIYRPGFSTAEKVTSISGRGVGMDVVMTNIKQLGGVVDIESKVAQGTKIHIVLPLTLAIVSGLVVKICEQVFILPEANIDEMVRIKPEEIESRIDIIQDSQVLRLRDVLLPLIDLKIVLGLYKLQNFENDDKDEKNEPMRILVIKHGSSRFGLIVDTVESIEEIVVKPLPRYLKGMKSFSGASIMGNGSVSLILDVAGVVEKANLQFLNKDIEKMEAERKNLNSDEEAQTLLIFDNKTEEQFALPLQLITRIERVPAAKIEHIKEKQFLQYQGLNLRLIFLEDFLPITRPERSKEDTIGVIIPKHIKHPMGIVMENVIGTETTIVKLNTKTIMAPGIFGTSVLNGKITIFPDMYSLFQMSAPELNEPEDSDGEIRGKSDKYKILVVEDTPFFMMMITDYLTSAGYDVLQAQNGMRAISILESESVDAIISDIVMPELDGYGLIKMIREDDRWKNLPVIAVTSLADDKSSAKGLSLGFNSWELKLDKDRILKTLEKYI